VYTYEVHAYELHAHEVQAYEAHTHKVQAREMHAHEVHACGWRHRNCSNTSNQMFGIKKLLHSEHQIEPAGMVPTTTRECCRYLVAFIEDARTRVANMATI
jgi:hypothetical protein